MDLDVRRLGKAVKFNHTLTHRRMGQTNIALFFL